MGNTFDKQPERSGSFSIMQSSKHASSSSEKTNSSAAASASDESEYYLTDSEKRQLRLYFEMIYTERNGIPNREGLKLALHDEQNDLLLKTLSGWLESKQLVDYQQFEDAIVHAARVSSSLTIQAMWEVSGFCQLEEDDNDKTALFRFCRLTMILISEVVDTLDLVELDKNTDMLHSFYIAMARRTDPNVEIGMDIDALVSLVHEFTPHVAKAFHTYLSVRLLLAGESPSFKPFLAPALSHKSDVAPQLLLNALALNCEELQSDWKRLYSTTTDGLSFNRISHHVLGYEGPTCLLIKTSTPNGCVFGALTVERWKELNKFFGSSRTILFTFQPKFRIFRSKIPGNGAYQWLNSKSFGLPHGMGLGGSLEGFRVFIPDSLENCIARDSCPTFENGKLISGNGEEFEIDTLEIWGCGGNSRVEHGLKAQKANRKVIDEAIAKARKVDKAQFFDNSFDREFLLPNSFAHDKQKQERLEEY